VRGAVREDVHRERGHGHVALAARRTGPRRRGVSRAAVRLPVSGQVRRRRVKLAAFGAPAHVQPHSNKAITISQYTRKILSVYPGRDGCSLTFPRGVTTTSLYLFPAVKLQVLRVG
jgi:hypothetical protein